MMQKVIIEIPLRYHFGLIGMHSCPFRRNGGVGLSISNSESYIKATPTKGRMKFRARYISRMKQAELVALVEALVAKYQFEYRVDITVGSTIRSHIGLGSGTALTLGVIEALFIVNRHRYSREALIQESKRGGTSGIGVNTYFEGGAVLDIGVKSSTQNYHLPSSCQDAVNQPVKLSRVDAPLWDTCLILPSVDKPGLSEKEFFLEMCPIPDERAYEASYVLVFGLYGAICEKDFLTFDSAVKCSSELSWKRSEIGRYGASIVKVLEQFISAGVCVGMTSMGPGIYAFTPSGHGLKELIRSKGYSFIDLKVNNKGRRITLV